MEIPTVAKFLSFFVILLMLSVVFFLFTYDFTEKEACSRQFSRIGTYQLETGKNTCLPPSKS
jgi:hypothetical protein